jgi:uncharacterized protein (DUF58 family)
MSQPARNPERILRRLEWTVIRRLDGLLQGDYRTLFQGFGLDLADLREYQYGDDVRCIDWNVTARMSEPYVRRYLEDREVTGWFLLDLTPSVDFGTVTAQKRDLLVDFVGLLARLLTRRGNRIGAILYDGHRGRVIPGAGGKVQVLRLIHELSGSPRMDHSPPTDLAVLLDGALQATRRRSLVFVVSDFLSTPGWERPLGLLARRHEVLAVRIYDPREMDLPDMGAVYFEDAETGEQVYLDTSNAAFRRRYNEVTRRRERELQASFREAGVETFALSTEGDLVDSVVRFASLRRRRKQTPAAFRAQPRLEVLRR